MPRRVLITGAAGAIGSCLREGLRPLVDELVLTDVRAVEQAPGERFVPADLADRDAIVAAAEGVDAVVHLGAVPTEAPFDEFVGPNVRKFQAAVALGEDQHRLFYKYGLV